MFVERAGRGPGGLGPDHVALDDLVRQRSWAELDDRVARLVGWLRRDVGLPEGGHLATLLGNRVEALEVALAALVGGWWVTPVNRHLTVGEVAYVLGDSGARLVVTDDDHAAVVEAALAAPSPAGEDPAVVRAGRDLDAALRHADDAPPSLDVRPGGTMFYTSGTTGHPKGVQRAVRPTVAAQLDALKATGALLGLDGQGPHLVTGPLHHAAPASFAVMDLLAGAPVLVMPRFDAAGLLDVAVDAGVRTTHLVPTMFVRLLQLPEPVRAAFDPSGLHTVLHGAAPIAPAVKRAMIDWWGPVLVEYWGASEGGVVTVVDSEDWLAHPGTVGRPTATHQVLVTDDDGTELPPGQVGHLWCRNLAVDEVFRYHGDPERTAAAFRGPGTYAIGDMGYVDDEGYVHLADRATNMIISGGVNIYPAEVEAALGEHPDVADVAVFGVPDDEWGESVKAAVQLLPGVEASSEREADLLAFARTLLAGYKVPRTVDFHGSLPRSDNGKLYVRALRDPYWEGRDRRI